MRVGLTGGVGSGKSTVARLLADRGAVIIDADAIAREVVEPGTPGLAAVRAEFGPDVLTADGALDRPKLAGIVFADEAKRTALNDILHPLVRARSAELMAAAPPSSVVVYDVPLLVEADLAADFDLVLVVHASVERRLERLVGRGMSEADARTRIAAQATDEQRSAVADVLIDNDGTLEDLRAQVDEAWRRIVAASRAGLERPEGIG